MNFIFIGLLGFVVCQQGGFLFFCYKFSTFLFFSFALSARKPMLRNFWDSTYKWSASEIFYIWECHLFDITHKWQHPHPQVSMDIVVLFRGIWCCTEVWGQSAVFSTENTISLVYILERSLLVSLFLLPCCFYLRNFYKASLDFRSYCWPKIKFVVVVRVSL